MGIISKLIGSVTGGDLLSAGVSILGAVAGSKASKKAASTQADSAAQAAALQKQQFDKQVELQAPFREAGLTAQDRYMTLLGLPSSNTSTQGWNEQAYLQANPDVAAAVAAGQYSSGRDHYTRFGQAEGRLVGWDEQAYLQANPDVAAAVSAGQLQSGWDHYNKYGKTEGRKPTIPSGLTNASDPDFGKYARDFSMQDFEADPGYGFRLKEGLRSLDQQAAARGGLISGNALKAATRYGQDMGSQEYMNAYNRYQTNRSNQLNPLQSLVGTSQTATNTLSNASQNYANSAGNAYMDAGNARASGYVGQANALNSALSQGMNYYQNSQLLNSLNKSNTGMGGSSGGSPYWNLPTY